MIDFSAKNAKRPNWSKSHVAFGEQQPLHQWQHMQRR